MLHRLNFKRYYEYDIDSYFFILISVAQKLDSGAGMYWVHIRLYLMSYLQK